MKGKRSSAAQCGAGPSKHRTDPPVPAHLTGHGAVSNRAVRAGVPGRPVLESKEYTEDELEFLKACDAYRRARGARFLVATDYLKVLKGLGYKKDGVSDGG